MMEKIICFVQNEGEELEKFLGQQNDNSEIHLYTSIIESCENNLMYCFGELYSFFSKQKEKCWFVTDISQLQDLAGILFAPYLEKVIYLDQGVKQEFPVEWDVEGLMDFECKSLMDHVESKFMKLYILLLPSSDIKFIEKLAALSGYIVSEKKYNTWERKAVWIHFGRLVLYAAEQGLLILSEESLLFTVSMLMKLEEKAGYTNKYLEIILQSSKYNAENYYFAWNQYKAMGLRNMARMDEKTSELLRELYEKSYHLFMESVGKSLGKIPRNERCQERVLVFTIQYLTDGHSPTRTVMERCKTLKKMGKEVYLVNTAEQYLRSGFIPIYGGVYGKVMDEYNGSDYTQIGEDKFFFLQCPALLPLGKRIDLLVKLIRKVKPYYILSIGTGSMLADICGQMIPCASMGLAFSSVPKTMNKMKIIGRELSRQEKEIDGNEDIIESRFTFELRPQTKHFTKEECHIPRGKFVLAVIGLRLDSEVSGQFLQMLSKVCDTGGIHVVFAGIYEKYEEMLTEYPILSVKSNYIYQCEDVLALMEHCDLYVNPVRLGGGFSVIEAFIKGVPGVYTSYGDVYAAGGKEFAVNNLEEMADQILHYQQDKTFYQEMSEKAKERARLMTSSVDALMDLDKEICKRVERDFW